MARKMSKPYNTGLVLVKSESWIEKPKNKKKKVRTRKVDSAVRI
jgi:hypothetical protein